MSNIKRFKKNNFTITDNKLIKDERLSWKARGIFIYLWAMPDDWNFYVDEVAKHSKDGIKALKSGLSELEKYGYLKRTMLRNEKGLFGEMSWKLSDTGVFTVSTIFGPTDNSIDGKNGPTDNGTLLNKNNTKEKLITKEKDNKLSAREIEEDFEKLWKLYPNKKGKKNALAAYKRAIKKGVTNKEIQDGIVKYKKQIEIQGTEPRFIAQGSTWFNQERWNDEYDTKATPVTRNQYGKPHLEEKIPDWDMQTPKPQTQQDAADIEELMAKVNQKTAANKDKEISNEEKNRY